MQVSVEKDARSDIPDIETKKLVSAPFLFFIFIFFIFVSLIILIRIAAMELE